jgi:hypothetical protein
VQSGAARRGRSWSNRAAAAGAGGAAGTAAGLNVQRALRLVRVRFDVQAGPRNRKSKGRRRVFASTFKFFYGFDEFTGSDRRRFAPLNRK